MESVTENDRSAAASAPLRRKVSFAVPEPKAGDGTRSAGPAPPRQRPAPTRRTAKKKKKKQSPREWLKGVIAWWSIREPSARALEQHRIAQFRKVGLPPDASSEEATYRLHAPIGKIPDHAIKPASGPTPEQAYRKRQAERERERKRNESTSGQSRGSGSSRRPGGSRAPKTDPKKLAVAPWLAEEGATGGTQTPHHGGSGHRRAGSSRAGNGKTDPKKLLIAPWLAEEENLPPREIGAGVGTASNAGPRQGSSRSRKIDPKKLLVAPWLAEE